MSDPTASYHGGAATSAAANDRADHSREGRMRAVEAALREAGEGMTSEQLEKATGISHQSMGGVILKLIQAKRIHRPGGGFRRRTSTGAWAWVCYFGPGENVGRATRSDKEVAYAEILQRFTDALHAGRLVGAGASAAAKTLKDAGFRRTT